jgi:hypothetical protein
MRLSLYSRRHPVACTTRKAIYAQVRNALPFFAFRTSSQETRIVEPQCIILNGLKNPDAMVQEAPDVGTRQSSAALFRSQYLHQLCVSNKFELRRLPPTADLVGAIPVRRLAGH